MTKAEQRKRAVKLTLPVFCGYIVLGIAFGATLAQAGYGPVWALAISTLVYAGSLQFVMVPFLAGGTSLIAVALTALMVNARHLFYGLSCIERFGRMDKRIRPYMITSLTDETYSVFCGLSGDEEDGVAGSGFGNGPGRGGAVRAAGCGNVCPAGACPCHQGQWFKSGTTNAGTGRA